VGGDGELQLDGATTPEARSWLKRKGLAVPEYRPPEDRAFPTLPEYTAAPKGFVRKYTFDSLGGAREAAQRMADVVCPRSQSRRDF
jgi:hypothetical protein